MTWCFLHLLMICWNNLHDLLTCGGPTGLYQSGVTCTANILYHHWYCVWYRMVIPLSIPCWNYLMSSLNHKRSYGPLQLYLGSVHAWGTLWNTSLKWVGWCIYSGTFILPDLLYIPCLPPTNYFWSPCSPLRVWIMRCSRGWIFASKFLSRFPLKWIFHSSTLKYVGFPYVCNSWTDIYSWFTALYWCLIMQSMYQGAPFLQRQTTLWLHNLDCCRYMSSSRP